MATPSTNIAQTPIAGKYGRVFIQPQGTSTLLPVNFRSWRIRPNGDNVDTTGFESFGWEEGVMGVIRSTIELEGPYQLNRTGATVGAGLAYLTVPGQLLVFELFLVHPDLQAAGIPFGSNMKYTGVGQVLAPDVDQEVQDHTKFMCNIRPRGQVYFPTNASLAPSKEAMLANFTNQLT